MCLLFKKQMKLSEAGKESFIVAKLSETAERAEQVLAKMQVALGFVVALMAALLAVIAAIFQAICSNSFLPPPKEIIDFWNYCEMLSVPANSILWAMAGLTATIGCISNLIALAIQLTAANFYISLVKEHNEVVGSIADTNGLSEKYGSIIELPELPKRIKKGSIKRIYLISAIVSCAMAVICVTFACVSFVPILGISVQNDSIRARIILSFIFTFLIAVIGFLVGLKLTGYSTKES